MIAGLLPMAEATIDETWSTSGMRATGSDDCRIRRRRRSRTAGRSPGPSRRPRWRPGRSRASRCSCSSAGERPSTIVGAARGAQDALPRAGPVEAPDRGHERAGRPVVRPHGRRRGRGAASSPPRTRWPGAMEEIWACAERERPVRRRDSACACACAPSPPPAWPSGPSTCCTTPPGWTASRCRRRWSGPGATSTRRRSTSCSTSAASRSPAAASSASTPAPRSSDDLVARLPRLARHSSAQHSATSSMRAWSMAGQVGGAGDVGGDERGHVGGEVVEGRAPLGDDGVALEQLGELGDGGGQPERVGRLAVAIGIGRGQLLDRARCPASSSAGGPRRARRPCGAAASGATAVVGRPGAPRTAR